MIVIILFLLIIGGLAYAYLNDQEQFTTTASAIHQIWSGNCRLACRQARRPQNDAASDQDRGSQFMANSSMNEYDSDLYRTNRSTPICVCESCPCGLVDDILRTYGPVRMDGADALSHYYYSGLQWIANSYNALGAALGSLGTCDRQAQFTSLDRMGSEENFSFGATPPKKGVSLLKKKSALSVSTEEGTSKGQRDMSVIKFASDDDKSDTNNCSRCISQGKTCMRSCPKAKK